MTEGVAPTLRDGEGEAVLVEVGERELLGVRVDVIVVDGVGELLAASYPARVSRPHQAGVETTTVALHPLASNMADTTASVAPQEKYT